MTSGAIGLQPQAEERDPEDRVAVEAECVLAEGIADDILGPGMVDAVDLDDEPIRGPVEIEVVAASSVAADRLPSRWW